MASTTTNGVVLEKPYGIVRNLRATRMFTFSVIGPDPLHDRVTTLREFPANWQRSVNRTADGTFFVYIGDKIRYELQAPCNDAAAAAFDLVAVNQSTGVETHQITIGFNAVWNKRLLVTITDIDTTTGVMAYTTSWS